MLELNTIYCGDCLGIMQDIADHSVDCILCDLPYGTTRAAWDVIIPFGALWEQYKRVIKENGVIILTGTEPFSSRLRLSNLDWYKYDWIWNKIAPVGFLNAKKQPLRVTENISVFYQHQPVFHPQMTHGHERKQAKAGGPLQIPDPDLYESRRGCIGQLHRQRHNRYSGVRDGQTVHRYRTARKIR